jgi:hypothetical protein
MHRNLGFRRKLALMAAVVAAVVALAAQARAESSYEDGNPARAFDRSLWLFRFGMAVGTVDVADLHGAGMGVHGSLARAFGKLAVKADYDALSVSESEPYLEHPRAGVSQRGALGVRWQPIGMLLGKRLNTGFWVQGTVGRQWFIWDKGGTLTRNDVELAVGLDFLGNFAEWGERAKIFGFGWSFRFLFAENPYADVPTVAVCGGPCDMPTRAPRYDLSFLFVLELAYGR